MKQRKCLKCQEWFTPKEPGYFTCFICQRANEKVYAPTVLHMPSQDPKPSDYGEDK